MSYLEGVCTYNLLRSVTISQLKLITLLIFHLNGLKGVTPIICRVIIPVRSNSPLQAGERNQLGGFRV